jgi:hypothetical protein
VGAFCVYPDEYRPKQPKITSLFKLLDIHYKEFRNVYDERFSKRYGYWRSVTDEVVEKYLRCGDPFYGFARIRCKKCGGQMKAISFIEQPSVIRHILKHLDLWKNARPPPEPLELVCETDAEYIPWQDDVPEIEVG